MGILYEPTELGPKYVGWTQHKEHYRDPQHHPRCNETGSYALVAWKTVVGGENYILIN